MSETKVEVAEREEKKVEELNLEVKRDEEKLQEKSTKFSEELMNSLVKNELALPKGFIKERWIMNTIHAMNDVGTKKVDLTRYKRAEVLEGMLRGAMYNLEYGNEFYLLPYKDGDTQVSHLNFQFDYKGLIKIWELYSVRKIKNKIYNLVYEGDEFSVDAFSDKPIHHVMKFQTTDRDKIVAGYCAIEYFDGGIDYEIMNKQEIDKIKQCSKQKTGAIWGTWYEAMALKSVVRRLKKKVVVDFGERQDLMQFYNDDGKDECDFDKAKVPQDKVKIIDITKEEA